MTALGLTNIAQLTKSLRERSVNALTIAKKSLQLADKLSECNAFITLTPEVATKQALQCDSQLITDNSSKKSLNGVTIAVKDNFCTEGIRTTCASKMLKNFVPTYNATVYERLKNAGTVLIGKTNLDQFAMGSGTVDSIFGPTKNIWSDNITENNFRIAGGSSGGSAVAVASGICYGAIGSDTGGSTRNPAAYCGLVGLKPSYGLLSRHGLIPLANSLDVPGILTRNVEDCLAILNATAGPDQFDSTTIKQKFIPITLPDNDSLSVQNIRIGIPLEYHCKDLSEEMLQVWRRIANLLEDNGAIVKQVSLPNTASSIVVYSVLNQCEVSSNMARYDGIEFGHRSDDISSTEKLYARTRAEGFNIVVKNRILAGNYFLLRKNYEKYYIQALKVRRLIANDFINVFNNNIDLLLTPTTLSDAPYYKDFIKSDNRHQCAVQDYCTQPANMAGIPAVTIPINLSSNKLPLSIQLMGPFLSEKLLLTVAKWIEREVCFPSFIKN